jgi:hypothetical protein
MEIHKPKPFHNAREFLTELFIVVLGVSIALAAEQTVEWLHWRAQVAEARELIATELAGNVRQSIWRMRTATCVERRLDELGTILDGAAKTGSLPPVGYFATPVRGFWPNGSWDSVVASQTATHFPRPLLAKLTTAYKQVTLMGEFSTQEIAAWNVLYTMVGPGRRLDAASEARLREGLSQARSVNRLMSVVSTQLTARVDALGLPFSREDIALIAEGRSAPLSTARPLIYGAVAVGAICAPIGKVPPQYGEGLYGTAAPLMDEAVKTLPTFSGSAR